jgi:DNA-binding winged helix-turn-helix (wHTH) protein
MLVRPRQRLVRFGVFEFDPASGDLWRAGRRIKLQHQPRQVLRILVERRGGLVTREELRRELWPDDTFVDFDNGLNVAVRKIRDALGDVVSSPRFIETERARGYRFIAPASEDLPPPIERVAQLRDLTDGRIASYLFGWTLYYHGEQPRAEASLESLMDDEGPVPGNARATLAALRAARGATADARRLADRVAAEPELVHHAAYGLATACAQLREPERAVRWLSQAAATGFPCYPWFDRDPLLDPIRRDARFLAFMGDLRRSWESARARFIR